MKYFIVLDAHSKTSTFAIVDQIGQCILRKTVNTTEKNLSWIIDQIQGERDLTFEGAAAEATSSGADPFFCPHGKYPDLCGSLLSKRPFTKTISRAPAPKKYHA